MKQETNVLIDKEYMITRPIIDIVRMLIEFGAPITTDSLEEKEINIEGTLEHRYLDDAGMMIYRWVKEVERGPGGITIYVKSDGIIEHSTRAEF